MFRGDKEHNEIMAMLRKIDKQTSGSSARAGRFATMLFETSSTTGQIKTGDVAAAFIHALGIVAGGRQRNGKPRFR